MPILLALAVAIAVWKPWDAARDGTGERVLGPTVAQTSAGSQPGSPSPSPSPSPHPAALACISSEGWRVVTRDVTAGRESRSWIAVDPAVAAGPHDEAVPSVRVVVGRLMALGYCAPVEISHVPRQARLWRIEPRAPGTGSPRPEPSAGATPRPISPLRRLYPPAAGVADLFAPPAREQRWTAGTYVFEVLLGRSRDPLWFSVEVVDSPPVPDRTSPPSPNRPATSP